MNRTQKQMIASINTVDATWGVHNNDVDDDNDDVDQDDDDDNDNDNDQVFQEEEE